MRSLTLAAVVILSVGLLTFVWIRSKDSKRMAYNLYPDGTMCEVSGERSCFDLVSMRGTVAFPSSRWETDGVAVINVDDGVSFEILGRAIGHFAENNVAHYLIERRDGVAEEKFRYVAPLMGIGANGPVRWAIDHAPAGYFDAGGLIALEGFKVLSVEVMNDRIFFGSEEVSVGKIGEELDGVDLSAVCVRFRKGSHLGGFWKLLGLKGMEEAEIIPFAASATDRQ